ncbi:MAG: hypothetical protein ACRC8S_09735 [Fimbriiglobus sp.]
MNTIKAFVRNGRIETEEPLNLPDMTELMIQFPDANASESDWDTSPEAIAVRLEAYMQLEPLILTSEVGQLMDQDHALPVEVQ